MKHHIYLLNLFVLFTSLSMITTNLTAVPQLQQGSVVNAGSFALAGTPNSAIAQGSLFTVFGVDIGPEEGVHADAFPLPSELGGVTVTVSANGVDYPAILLFVLNTQLSAILPSDVPVEEASLVVTYNGESSEPVTFAVAERQPGLFTRTQDGMGFAVVQNYLTPDIQPLNSMLTSAQPGQVVTLWLTGLGASLNGSDNQMPAPGNMAAAVEEVQLIVGGKPAVVEYAGRSGCCAGVDQINFIIPDGVEGCRVPVAVVDHGIASNFATISISGEGDVCSDPSGLTSSQIESALGADQLKLGYVALMKSLLPLGAAAPGQVGNTLMGTGEFWEYNAAGLEGVGTAGLRFSQPVGSCQAGTRRIEAPPAVLPDPRRIRNLDAGPSLTVDGLDSPLLLEKQDVDGRDLYLGPMPPQSTSETGQYTVSNGDGGEDVGPFSISLEFQTRLTFAETPTIDRSQPLTVTWDPASAAGPVLRIIGFSGSESSGIVGSFTCSADPSAGEFTIPAYILAPLPKTDPDAEPINSVLIFRSSTALKAFQAEGLDLGMLEGNVDEQRLVQYD